MRYPYQQGAFDGGSGHYVGHLLDLVSPLTLYYNFDLIVDKGQYWRLISSSFSSAALV